MAAEAAAADSSTMAAEAAAADSSEKKITLNLLIDKNDQKVLFAEAGKEFVDFLFSLLLLPIDTVNRLLGNEATFGNGSLPNLRQSFKNLEDVHIQSNAKDVLMRPESYWLSYVYPQARDLLPLDISTPTSFSSSTNYYYQYDHYGNPVRRVSQPTASASVDMDPVGFVKGVLKYMVTDDLVVKPMSTISSISLVKELNVEKQLEALEEMVVEIGMDQGPELLKNALSSKTVLTNVFLAVAETSDSSPSLKKRAYA